MMVFHAFPMEQNCILTTMVFHAFPIETIGNYHGPGKNRNVLPSGYRTTYCCNHGT